MAKSRFAVRCRNGMLSFDKIYSWELGRCGAIRPLAVVAVLWMLVAAATAAGDW